MYFVSEWEQEITVNGVVKYLNEHLKQSIINDFETAYLVYINRGNVGYFGSLRILFPSITFLGALYGGYDSSSNVVLFIKNCLGKFNDVYKNIGDVLYAVYRHGLIHTNMPKVIIVNNVDVGWVITFNDNLHLNFNKIGLKEYNIWISPHQLYIDLLSAIDSYITELKDINNIHLINNFKRGFIQMTKYHREQDIQMNCRSGFDYINKKIHEKSYSDIS